MGRHGRHSEPHDSRDPDARRLERDRVTEDANAGPVAQELTEGVRLGYRPELDGLRAVAVAAVIGHHYWWATSGGPFRGGFLGVDLFFVLSGFLITRLLLEEQASTHAIRL